MRRLSALALLFLASCAGADAPGMGSTGPQPAQDSPVTPVATRMLSGTEKALLGRFLAQGLKDPTAAHFQWAPFPAVSDGTTPYCAQVNAKNGYGGYNGMQPFIATVELRKGKIVAAALVGIADPRPDYARIVPDLCRKEGLNPYSPG